MEKWSKEDLEFLIENYNLISKREIANKLNKQESAVTQKAYRLRISKISHWSEEDINFLKENYSSMDNLILEKLLKRKRHNIVTKAIELGLSKKIFPKKYNKEQFLENVKKFSESLGRTPYASEVMEQEWGLPNASLNRYFGGYRNVCKILDLEININIFGSKVPNYYSKNGDLCWSKAELLITDFFIDNNIKYEKEIFYKNYCEDKRFNNKTADWILNNNLFVEYFGMMDKAYYKEKAQNKISLCFDNKLTLIPLLEKDIKNLDTIFQDLIG